MSFHPKSLTNIRRMYGFTYDKVANELGVGVNRIIMFEGGESRPNATEIIALAKLFNVKSKYFYRPDVLEGKDRQVMEGTLSIRG